VYVSVYVSVNLVKDITILFLFFSFFRTHVVCVRVVCCEKFFVFALFWNSWAWSRCVSYQIIYSMIWYDMIYDMIWWYDMIFGLFLIWRNPQSQLRWKNIRWSLYRPRPFQRYQFCQDWEMGTKCLWATKPRRQSEKYSYIG
jgi:hypothetical protein